MKNIWINNGTIEIYKQSLKEVPNGFELGRLPRDCPRCGQSFIPNRQYKKFCKDCYDYVRREKVCPVCNKTFRIHFQDNECCSKKCAKKLNNNFKNPLILKKIADTCMERYRVDNPFKLKEIQEKCKLNNDRKSQSLHQKLYFAEKYKDIREQKDLFKNRDKKLSKKEAIILNDLKTSVFPHHQQVQFQKTFEDCSFINRLRFDFYIPESEYNCAYLIEYDGEQHFKPIQFNNITESQSYKNYIYRQVTDWIKDYYCIEKNIPLIRIPYKHQLHIQLQDLMKDATIVSKIHGSDNKIDIIYLNENDFINNRQPTFNIGAGISCTFKCCKCNPEICQNSPLATAPSIHTSIDKLIERYLHQSIAKSVTIQGLEPLDNLKQILWFIFKFRKCSEDPIYLWTGYTAEECKDLIHLIKEKCKWQNIIIKFGRYIPNQQPHYDPVLGIYLASDNQYAEKIS